MPDYLATLAPQPGPDPTIRNWLGGIALPHYHPHADAIEGHRTVHLYAVEGNGTEHATVHGAPQYRATVDVLCTYTGRGRWELSVTGCPYILDAAGEHLNDDLEPDKYEQLAQLARSAVDRSMLDTDALTVFRRKILAAELARAEEASNHFAAQLAK